MDDICKAGQGISSILLNSAMCLSVPGVKGTSLTLVTNSAMCLSVPGVKGTSLTLVTKPLGAAEHVKTPAYG